MQLEVTVIVSKQHMKSILKHVGVVMYLNLRKTHLLPLRPHRQ